ncbi:FtsW/RodA/SpoVE family cell cycle protein [Bacillus sp. FJAT-29790]|uniref:FtsW/RodA/SpoVE family cell cycle protein n=1 Tax=Bacillus sp. FJAT-29790 TaxID=1895002 RepID=UPI001C239B58|nr:FtsW/RodA/SpoVE family cell cycle protein [Bacillus sp. FJAT-29790]
MSLKGFLDQVTNHIRSKEAKEMVGIELRNHLQSLVEEYEQKGYSKTEAETKAVQQMGDPETIGRKMNKLHRPKVDWSIISIFLLILGLSLLPTFMLEGYYNSIGYNNYLLTSKIKAILLGVFAIAFFMLFDYRKLMRHGMGLYGLGISILILLSLFGKLMNGRPYFHFAGFSADATVALPFLFIAWAIFFSARNQNIGKLTGLFLLSFLILAYTSHLFLVLLYSVLIIGMLFFSQLKKKEKVIITLVSAVIMISGSTVYFLKYPNLYLKERFLGFIHPEQHINGAGYINVKLQELLPKAGWFGQGKLSEAVVLPELHTDFVFFTMTYLFGWSFALFLVTILVILSIRMMWVSKVIQDPFGRLIVFGANILFTFQFLYSILMTFGWLPIAGVSLPFFSHGSMAFVFNSFLLGLVLSVYRRKQFFGVNYLQTK